MTEKRSPWRRDGTLDAALEPLDRDLVADVVVVGAGMSGLLCALELAERGRRVIVVERQGIAAGETGVTTAHLSTVLDNRYFELASMHGAQAARSVATSHMRGIAHLERVANAHRIECGFRRLSGFLCAATQVQADELERERRAASEAGISCELVRAAPFSIANGPALHFPHQAEFEALAFLAGVVQALRELDVAIYAPVTVSEFETSRATDQVGLRTSDGHSIRANFVVVASNSPINDLAALHTKQAAYRTYALSFAIARAQPALCWDLEDPYHYVRTAFDSTTQQPVLIVGGEDHRVGQDPDHGQQWARLEGWTRGRFPDVGVVVSRWSGQVLEPSDGLAFIGKNSGDPRVLVLTGASGNGMTYAAFGAELIADLVCGVENPFQKLYDPARKPSSVSAVSRFVRENLNTVEQYADWVGPADAASAADIARGEGAVLRRGLTRVAVYVDESGLAHEVSATCPHLGGVVAWNSAEKSWDCPCHGSRFDCHGKVLAGPAVSDLVPLAKKQQPDIEKAS